MHKAAMAIGWALFVLSANLVYPQRKPQTDPADLMRSDSQTRAAWAADWLDSDDPRRIAWGARVALVDRLTDLEPNLLRIVTLYQSHGARVMPGENPEHDMMLVVLDALVQLHAAVPVEEAHRLHAEFPAASMILLVRAGDAAQDALLDIFDHTHYDEAWLAAGNILIARHTAGFAFRVLNRFTQHLTVAVLDPAHVGGGGVGGGSECGLYNESVRANWPPMGLYYLSRYPGTDPGSRCSFSLTVPLPCISQEGNSAMSRTLPRSE